MPGTLLILGHLSKNSPKVVLFKTCFPAKGCFYDASEKGTETGKLRGWDFTSLTLTHSNQRP